VILILASIMLLFHMLLVHLAQDVSRARVLTLVVLTSLVTITDRAIVLN